jgi:hypothetical protein
VFEGPAAALRQDGDAVAFAGERLQQMDGDFSFCSFTVEPEYSNALALVGFDDEQKMVTGGQDSLEPADVIFPSDGLLAGAYSNYPRVVAPIENRLSVSFVGCS